MPDWLSDFNLLGFVVATVLGIAGIAVTIFIWRSDRVQKRKRLGYKVLSNSPVIGPSVVDQSEWRIEYKGEAVFDPYVMELRLENIGAVPVRLEDFEAGRPITIGSGREAMFIAISRRSTYPGRLSLSPELDDHEIRINPMLMNRGEGFTLTVVTVGKCDPKPSARIAGLDKGIEEGIPEKRSMFGLVQFLLALAAVVIIIVDLIDGFRERVPFEGQEFWYGALAALLATLLAGYSSAVLLRLRSRIRAK